ncbi:MAG: hypothetical protein WC144_03665 [Sulfurimonas sp.]|jgi:hypothetical protein|nr:hypothetical protein [Sulfurimonadaceae bacterium]
MPSIKMNLEINYKTIYKLFANSSLILDKSTINLAKELNANIPNSFGVYIFYKNSKSYENITYIGKAGEIRTLGEKKAQGLQKRVTNIRDNKPANIYYKDIFSFLNLDKLIIEYFETSQKLIPAFVEASLIQEYYLNNNRLPILNKSF